MPDVQLPLILYVEDDALISIAVLDALEEAGFRVEHVMDGRAALDALDARIDDYAALVTDVRLPEADGWDIAHRARELRASIPVVYASGDSAADWASKGVPNSLMLQKPFANAQLITAVTTLINDARLASLASGGH